MFYILLLLILCAATVLALYEWLSRDGRLLRRIPGPRAVPVIGNALSFTGTPEMLFKLTRSLHKNYGPLHQIHAINTRMVNVSNPEDLEILLSSPEYITKLDPYTFAKPWLGEGLLTSNGSKWRQRRKMLTTAFHFNILKKFMVTFREETEEFVKQVEEETFKEKTDLLALISPATLRIICETAMGVSLRHDKTAFSTYFNAVLTMGECIILRISKFWLHNDFLFSFSEIAKKQDTALKYLHGFTNKVINDRRKIFQESYFSPNEVSYEKNEKMALLDLLLQSEKSGMIDNDGIREEVNTFMFEGFDTTSVGVSFFLMAIANEPAIQEKIYEEIQQILGDAQRSPTMEELNQMKYLECCLKESMRLYPSAPFIVRRLLKDTILSGYTVPAGTNCFLYIYDLHRRADLFPDPERFDPDRFLPEHCLKRNVYSYIPFSAGLRNCIGQKFAMLEMKMLLSGLLRRFRLDPVSRPSDLVYRTDVVLRTVDPMYVRFRSRQ